MKKKKYLNNEPMKEGICPDCKQPTIQRRVYMGKLRIVRMYVHKKSRKKDCELCDQCHTTERYTTLDGKSLAIDHNYGCPIISNSTNTG